MGELGALVEAWRDRRDPRPSDAWIGRKVGARSRSTVKPWLTGASMPEPQHLRELATLIGVNYRRVLDAALLDAGYLTEMEHRDGHPAPTTSAERASASRVTEDRATARTEPPRAPMQTPTDETPRPAQP